MWKQGLGSTPPCTLRVPQRDTHFCFQQSSFHKAKPDTPHPPANTPLSTYKGGGLYNVAEGLGFAAASHKKTGQREGNPQSRPTAAVINRVEKHSKLLNTAAYKALSVTFMKEEALCRDTTPACCTDWLFFWHTFKPKI